MKLIGLARLGRDVEVRFTPAGDPVANLALAFNYGKKDQQGNRPTTWVDASLWGDRAQKLAEWMTKGRELMVEVSDVHVETYEGRNGFGAKLVGRVDSVQFTSGDRQSNAEPEGRQGGGQRTQQRQASAQDYQGARDGGRPAAYFSDIDDQIPF